jgi:hypothetical protein
MKKYGQKSELNAQLAYKKLEFEHKQRSYQEK